MTYRMARVERTIGQPQPLRKLVTSLYLTKSSVLWIHMKDMEHHELTRGTVIEFYNLTVHITALVTVCRRPCSSYTYVVGRGTSWLE